jgi:hypothetical protein
MKALVCATSHSTTCIHSVNLLLSVALAVIADIHALILGRGITGISSFVPAMAIKK